MFGTRATARAAASVSVAAASASRQAVDIGQNCVKFVPVQRLGRHLVELGVAQEAVQKGLVGLPLRRERAAGIM